MQLDPLLGITYQQRSFVYAPKPPFLLEILSLYGSRVLQNSVAKCLQEEDWGGWLVVWSVTLWQWRLASHFLPNVSVLSWKAMTNGLTCHSSAKTCCFKHSWHQLGINPMLLTSHVQLQQHVLNPTFSVHVFMSLGMELAIALFMIKAHDIQAHQMFHI